MKAINVTIRQNATIGIGAFCWLQAALAPVYASDTEVYVSAVTTSGSSSPTLMLLLDSSDEMLDPMGSTADCPAPYNLTSRYGHLKCAMQRVLYGIGGTTPLPGNIKVGLAIYNPQGSGEGQGGYIRVPARPLDQVISSGSSTTGTTSTISTSVASKFDDVEFAAGNSSSSGITWNSNDLDVADNSGTARNQVALRFAGIGLPAGVTIDEAYLAFTPNHGSSYPNLEVQAYDSGNFPAICVEGQNQNQGVCTVPTTTLSAALTLSTSAQADGTHRLDITALTQDLANRTDWSSGNAMGFLIQRSAGVATANTNDFYSIDGANNNQNRFPKLVIRYTTTTTSSSNVTQRDLIWQAIDGTTPSGSISATAAYVEAASYLMGGPVYETSLSVADSRSGNTYQSPLDTGSECSGAYIYQLTAGYPNNSGGTEQHGDDLLSHWHNPTDCGAPNGGQYDVAVHGTQLQSTWACDFNVADWLSGGDNLLDIKVKTSTVAFGPAVSDKANLVEVATFGDGKQYDASDASGIVSSLLDTAKNLLDDGGSISAPGVAVNQLSRLTHLDQLFYAVFDPDNNAARWLGNVKGFRLHFDSTGQPIIKDYTVPTSAALSKNAVDQQSGFFNKDVTSRWSDVVDGNIAINGGAAGELTDPTTRKLLTYFGSYPTNGTGQSLTTIDTTDSTFNTNAMSAMAEADSNRYQNIMNWFKGYDLSDEETASTTLVSLTGKGARKQLGAVLHSRPVVVNYGYVDAVDTTVAQDIANAEANADLQDNILFFSTLGGSLHAVDVQNGSEVFSFTPRELFPTLKTTATNPLQSQPAYGLDGSITVWRNDGNGDKRITTDSTAGDFIYLYGGMRMGGRNIYALDVTDIRDTSITPNILWAITPTSNSAYNNIGQTWSQPTLGAVKIGGTLKQVLFIGGGYDSKHETANYSSPTNDSDSQGNQIYIVDAKTGALLWWASNSGSPTKNVSDMKFSIPGELKLRDLNSDGLTDVVYFGDLGGQVFRMDIDNGNTGASSLVVRVQKIAALGQTETADTTNQRRFYEPPAVALLKDANDDLYAAVAVGSGYRSHPLDEGTQDRLYVLQDYDVTKPDILTTTSLAAAIGTTDLAQLNLSGAGGVTLTNKRGWYIELPDDGEKVLAAPLILNSEVWFTTYVPERLAGSFCSPVIGRTKLWRMALRDGSLATGTTTRVTDNFTVGLGADPQIIVNAVPTDSDGDGDIDSNDTLRSYRSALCVGITCITGPEIGQPQMRRMRWFERTKQ